MFTPSLIHSVELYNSRSVGGSGLVRGGVCLPSANGNPTVGFCGARHLRERTRGSTRVSLCCGDKSSRGVHKHMHGLTEILQSREHFHTVAPET
jgi:hypothetical protein